MSGKFVKCSSVELDPFRGALKILSPPHADTGACEMTNIRETNFCESVRLVEQDSGDDDDKQEKENVRERERERQRQR